MSRYAANTSVPVDRSRTEIERTLQRYGARAFAYGWDQNAATIMFEIADRRVRFRLPVPDSTDPGIARTPTGRPRSQAQREQAFEQAQRQSWRALVLIIKAKLEAIEAGIATVESEFLAHIMLPDGSTVGEWAGPQLSQVYGSGRMPALMPGGGR